MSCPSISRICHLIGVLILLSQSCGSGCAEESQLVIRFRLPSGSLQDRSLILAQAFSEGVPSALAPLKLLDSQGDGSIKATFQITPSNRPIIFGLPYNWGPLGTVTRTIPPGVADLHVDIPSTFYAANWSVPDALARKLDLDPGGTYLIIKKVVPEKTTGTVYDPYFAIHLKLAKNLKDEAYDKSFFLPFLDPGTYEFTIGVGGEMREVLRKRLVLDLNNGLRELKEHRWDELSEIARNGPLTLFDATDIIPKGAIHSVLDLKFPQ